jgi:hypothetical protein
MCEVQALDLSGRQEPEAVDVAQDGALSVR